MSGYRFSGPQAGSKNRNKGVMRSVRSRKRAQAEGRNSEVLHEDTKAHRLDRCSCPASQ